MFDNVAVWIRKIFQRGGRAAPIVTKAKDANWRSYRPWLEALEDRTLPTVSITGFTTPTWGNQGAALPFSAVATNTESEPLTYSWDFGDNRTAAGESVTQSFGAVTPANQPRSIHLVVTDGTSQAEQTASLEIRNAAPTASLNSTLTNLYAGDTIPLTATATDPGGIDDPLTVEWDFNYNGTFNADANATGTLSQNRTFTTSGQTVVAVRVTDQAGATDIATRTFTVTALPSVSIEADDDAPVIDVPTTYYVTFDGDSSGFTGVAWDLNYNGTTFNPTANFTDWTLDATFANVGTPNIATRVTDAAGQQIITTLAVTVHYPAPDLTVGNDFSTPAGQQTTLQATVSDPNAIAGVQWYFSYDGIDYELQSNLTQLSQSYTFAHYGEYDVLVHVTDIHGEQAEAGFHVTVAPPMPTAIVSVNGPINQLSPRPLPYASPTPMFRTSLVYSSPGPVRTNSTRLTPPSVPPTLMGHSRLRMFTPGRGHIPRSSSWMTKAASRRITLPT